MNWLVGKRWKARCMDELTKHLLAYYEGHRDATKAMNGTKFADAMARANVAASEIERLRKEKQYEEAFAFVQSA
jgi:hypothetical protein